MQVLLLVVSEPSELLSGLVPVLWQMNGVDLIAICGVMVPRHEPQWSIWFSNGFQPDQDQLFPLLHISSLS